MPFFTLSKTVCVLNGARVTTKAYGFSVSLKAGWYPMVAFTPFVQIASPQQQNE